MQLQLLLLADFQLLTACWLLAAETCERSTSRTPAWDRLELLGNQNFICHPSL